MPHFNTALLVKQGWRLIEFSNCLLARVLKARYYPHSDFLNACLGNLPSYTWQSIYASQRLLEKGLCWRVGNGIRINVAIDAWILSSKDYRFSYQLQGTSPLWVIDLIDNQNRQWTEALIRVTFSTTDADRILRIPLALNAHDDLLVWKGKTSGDFSVRSA